MIENQKVEHIHKTDYQYNFVNEVSLSSLNCSVVLRSSDTKLNLKELIEYGLFALTKIERGDNDNGENYSKS